jgi:WD40 repeat protein
MTGLVCAFAGFAAETLPKVDALGDPLPEFACARVGTLRFRHSNQITSLFFMDNDRMLVTSGGGRIKVWSVPDGALLRSFKADATVMIPSPEGTLLAVAGGEDIQLLNMETGAVIRKMKGIEIDKHFAEYGSVNVLRFSPDGKTLASGAAVDYSGPHSMIPFVTDSVQLWDVETGTKLKAFGTRSDWLRSFEFSLDGHRILGPGFNHKSTDDSFSPKMFEWQLSTSEEKCAQISEMKGIRGLVLSADGKSLAAWSEEAVEVQDVASGQKLRNFHPPKKIQGIALSRDLMQSATWDENHHLFIRSANQIFDDRDLGVQEGLYRWSEQSNVVFSDNGTVVAAATGHAVKLWDTYSGKRRDPATGHEGEVNSIFYSPDGDEVSTGDRNGAVRFWNPKTGELKREMRSANGSLDEMAFSPDWQVLATTSSDHFVNLWDVKTGGFLCKLKGSAAPSRLTFSPDGKRFATAHDWSPPSIAVWDPATGKKLWETESKMDWTHLIAFMPDGKRLLSVHGSFEATILEWDADTGELLNFHPKKNFNVCGFLEGDRRMIAVGSPSFAPPVLWNLSSDEVLPFWSDREEGAMRVCISNDQRMVATTQSDDNTVHVWEVFTGREIIAFKGHEATSRAIVFSPDRRFIATGSEDTTALIWDLAAPFARPKASTLENDINAYWNELSNRDPGTAYKGVWFFMNHPDIFLKLADKRLQPIKPNREEINTQIKRLDDESFEVRHDAFEKLLAFDACAISRLQVAMNSNPSEDVRTQLTALVAELNKQYVVCEPVLQKLRSIQILEWTGGERALSLIDRLANAEPSRVQREARKTINRMRKWINPYKPPPP